MYLQVFDCTGKEGWGECAPLPSFSRETLNDCVLQFAEKQQDIIGIDWLEENIFSHLANLNLLPALSFALESALLSHLNPILDPKISVSALLTGTPGEIMKTADFCYREGYVSAKLKVGHLKFDEAAILIYRLKDKFRLRIDVNRAWNNLESLRFFSQFSKDDFDYIEEPFQNPKELYKFNHPFAVDESFPHCLSYQDLESFSHLKTIVYKPTVQGGILNCLPIKNWASKRNIAIVLSSSFESHLGHSHVASMASRLCLCQPIGIGTFHLSDSLLRG